MRHSSLIVNVSSQHSVNVSHDRVKSSSRSDQRGRAGRIGPGTRHRMLSPGVQRDRAEGRAIRGGTMWGSAHASSRVVMWRLAADKPTDTIRPGPSARLARGRPVAPRRRTRAGVAARRGDRTATSTGHRSGTHPVVRGGATELLTVSTGGMTTVPAGSPWMRRRSM